MHLQHHGQRSAAVLQCCTNIWPNWLKGLLALYICASAWQLSLLMQQPQIYLRSRMRINVANR
jgi:hypothetical protein